MKFLLLYKGNYGASLRGPEMRYLAVAESLSSLGHSVVLVGRSIDLTFANSLISFIRLNQFYALVKGFLSANVIVLHGGGPIVLMLALLCGFLGKVVVLDAYVPHWIELDEQLSQSEQVSFRIVVKSMFNVFRTFFSGLIFDQIIVANRRQQDIVRGISAAFFRTTQFDRVHIVPFGCSACVQRDKTHGLLLLNELLYDVNSLKESNFLVGWLGGVYGWFDVNKLLVMIAPALEQNRHIKLVFFGVDALKRLDMLSCLEEHLHGNIVFLSWVPFEKRLDYWAAFDLSLVWGGDGYENDYASRTRNFDCLSLALPILQNEDDEWGDRLRVNHAGIISSAEQLSDNLLMLSRSPEVLQQLKIGMMNLSYDFEWIQFARRLEQISQLPRLGALRRLVGVFALVMITPAILLLLSYQLWSSFVQGKK